MLWVLKRTVSMSTQNICQKLWVRKYLKFFAVFFCLSKQVLWIFLNILSKCAAGYPCERLKTQVLKHANQSVSIRFKYCISWQAVFLLMTCGIWDMWSVLYICIMTGSIHVDTQMAYGNTRYNCHPYLHCLSWFTPLMVRIAPIRFKII